VLLVDVTIRIDERHRRYHVDIDRRSKGRIDQESRCVGAETIVLAPCLSVSCAVGRRNPRREVIDALDACDCRSDLPSIEQIQLLGSWCADFVAGGLEERKERAPKHSDSAGYEHPHLSPRLPSVSALRRRATSQGTFLNTRATDDSHAVGCD
jgi:hypothetical protein